VTKSLTRKVLAYIVHRGKLLVFRHRDLPEAGIQVPGGTIHSGEQPEVAALRQAQAGTGLEKLQVIRMVGEQVRLMTSENMSHIHHRYFFLLKCVETPPATWTHAKETLSGGNSAPTWLEFSWARLPNGVPELSGGQDYCLYKMIDYLISIGECCDKETLN
jgi:ADP-ribose pyrophosphatase YjhB (NUDIX family)